MGYRDTVSDIPMFLIIWLISLVITIAIELTICLPLIIGTKDKRLIGGVIAVNLISHTVLNYFLFLQEEWIVRGLPIGVWEFLVIIGEWLMLTWMMKGKRRLMLILSVVMNLFSWGAGVIANAIFGFAY